MNNFEARTGVFDTRLSKSRQAYMEAALYGVALKKRGLEFDK